MKKVLCFLFVVTLLLAVALAAAPPRPTATLAEVVILQRDLDKVPGDTVTMAFIDYHNGKAMFKQCSDKECLRTATDYICDCVKRLKLLGYRDHEELYNWARINEAWAYIVLFKAKTGYDHTARTQDYGAMYESLHLLDAVIAVLEDVKALPRQQEARDSNLGFATWVRNKILEEVKQ